MNVLKVNPVSGSAVGPGSTPGKPTPPPQRDQPPALKGSKSFTITRTVVYKNNRGLHARPASLLVKRLSDFKCTITAECNGEQANAKSILGLLCLAVGSQSKVTFTATGPDSPEAMAVIERLFALEFEESSFYKIESR